MLSSVPTSHGPPSFPVRDAMTSTAITFELGDQLASYFGMAATCLLTYDISEFNITDSEYACVAEFDDVFAAVTTIDKEVSELVFSTVKTSQTIRIPDSSLLGKKNPLNGPDRATLITVKYSARRLAATLRPGYSSS